MLVGALGWSLVGSTIGEGINTALIFANTLLITIDWGMIRAITCNRLKFRRKCDRLAGGWLFGV